ncbi:MULTISPECIES: hypothetical protein [unclassified Paenibacillus]|uniref:hypothetical protein n=1 Tax=unclassified Paenibacillus TaxID=185978 RepID=UPI0009A7003A|nr:MULTISPECIES: hypothetical protein [unclassified Paenibacillus]SLK16806.1 hypothetical protein SAMN06272722_110256 [Paenibacillus sp. RU5A]SOC74485.1 hypothetical protein SAMN05880581_110256 [Paenibacillus sp. RU26A]SOC76674.1 hypothetical protein SAMN05880586_110256 [Paenibacillus sp. RU5M]
MMTNLCGPNEFKNPPLYINQSHLRGYRLNFSQRYVSDWIMIAEQLIELYYCYLYDYSTGPLPLEGEHNDYLEKYGFKQRELNIHLLANEIEYWGEVWRILNEEVSIERTPFQLINSFDILFMIKGLTVLLKRANQDTFYTQFCTIGLNIIDQFFNSTPDLKAKLQHLYNGHNNLMSNKYLYGYNLSVTLESKVIT